jgi:hypothetical protein
MHKSSKLKRDAERVRDNAVFIIMDDARCLKESHTVFPHRKWDKDEKGIKEIYDDMVRTARVLKRMKVAF